MINKEKLWFLTLFTLIIVLGVYYLSMPTNLSNTEDIEVSNTDTLTVLDEVEDVEYEEKIEELEKTITNTETTVEEKNNAYELMTEEKNNKIKCENLEEKLRDEFDLESNITIENKQIIVNINSNDNSYELANNIIKCIQKEYSEEQEIIVKFSNNI